jgi:7-cyano-7-deazaguanine reductase
MGMVPDELKGAPLDAPTSLADAHGVLGEKVGVSDTYDPKLLFPVPRTFGRKPLGLGVDGRPLPFVGEDVWNCYEVSWLQPSGVPKRKVLEARISHDTANLVESKSFKLYLNSLNFATFASDAELLATVAADLQPVLDGAAPTLVLHAHSHQGSLSAVAGDLDSYSCVDDACVDDFALDGSEHDRSITTGSGEVVSERLSSHQLRTLCPVTSQPDWGSIFIAYTGPQIDRGLLLRYVVSLRRETGFHEAAVEQIFQKIMSTGATALVVTGQFLRRGGIDINPSRTLVAV